MKIRLYYIIEDAGDGSAYVNFFPTQEAAEAELKEMEDNEDYERYSLSDGGFSVEDITVEDYEEII